MHENENFDKAKRKKKGVCWQVQLLLHTTTITTTSAAEVSSRICFIWVVWVCSQIYITGELFEQSFLDIGKYVTLEFKRKEKTTTTKQVNKFVVCIIVNWIQFVMRIYGFLFVSVSVCEPAGVIKCTCTVV